MRRIESLCRSITFTLVELEATHRALGLPPESEEMYEARLLVQSIEQQLEELKRCDAA